MHVPPDFDLDAIATHAILRPLLIAENRWRSYPSAGERRRSVRKFILAGVLLVGLTGPAWGQINTFLHPVNPNDIKFTPIDTSKAIVAAPLPTTTTSSFSLRNFFSRFSLSNLFSRPTIGSSTLPAPGSFPSTHYKNAFQPVMPVSGQ
jgi:hypothetical protein